MRRWQFLLLEASALLLALGMPALAQGPQQSYDLSWWTVDGGGETASAGGGYYLGGTAGQPDAGALTGGGYELGGGFWCGGAGVRPPQHLIYLPLVVRGHP